MWFFFGYICGLVFFLGIFNWILEVPGYTQLHHAILALYLGSYVGVFGLVFCLISRRVGIASAFFAAPFLWVSLEYIRSNLSFLALPWGLLAHSQYQVPSVIQIVSLTGVYGISFLIVIVNSAISAMVYQLLRRLRKEKGEDLGGIKLMIVTAAVLVVFSLIYGYIKISKPIAGKEIKISVVQGNIEQDKKWDRKYAKFIMETYADLTLQAEKDGPVLIVWPEAATPGAINRVRGHYSQVKHIARTAGTWRKKISITDKKTTLRSRSSLLFIQHHAFLMRIF